MDEKYNTEAECRWSKRHLKNNKINPIVDHDLFTLESAYVALKSMGASQKIVDNFRKAEAKCSITGICATCDNPLSRSALAGAPGAKTTKTSDYVTHMVACTECWNGWRSIFDKTLDALYDELSERNE